MSKVDTLFLDALTDTSVFLPELPQADAFDTLALVREYERYLILPAGMPARDLLEADYSEGSATEDDQVIPINTGMYGVLASADHATDPMRKGERKGADHGTGGLVQLLAKRDGLTGIVPIGRQTGNAAFTRHHKIKLAMDHLLLDRPGFLSVHGMRAGKLRSFEDETEIHAIVGLGLESNEQSRLAAERLVKFAIDMGLRVIVGNDGTHREYDRKTDDFARDEEGNIVDADLAALGPGTTTNHAYKIMRSRGFVVPAFQVEMTRLLRLLPSDFESGWHKDEKARAMGVHSGYLLMRAAAEFMASGSAR